MIPVRFDATHNGQMGIMVSKTMCYMVFSGDFNVHSKPQSPVMRLLTVTNLISFQDVIPTDRLFTE